MIVTRVYGGLAGQMFQYALGRHLSLKNNKELYLDTSWYKKENNSKFTRDFGLSKLNTAFKAFDKSNMLWWKIKLDEKLDHTRPFGFRFVREKDFTTFDPSVLQSGSKSVIDGYWNSHKYFQAIREKLLAELSPADSPDQKNRECLEHIVSVNAISVHFRRGDYALTTFHGMLSKEYYETAIDLIAREVANPHLFIFSDEPNWVMSNMDFRFPYTIIDFNKDEKNHWDIVLMKACQHNIIANSGFSWWGAWLNENADKKVIAPAKWVNEGSKCFDNMPEGWITL